MNAALKEWSSITDAIAEGRQIAVLRKGGIVEATRGGFHLRHDSFVLFPTYEHQGLPTPDEVSISVVIQHCEAFRAPEDPQRLLDAREFFIWDEAFVRKRYEYRPDLPLWLMIVKAALLPNPVLIPNRPSYVGCKSWVNLTEEIEVSQAIPVHSEAEFAARKAALLQATKAGSHLLS